MAKDGPNWEGLLKWSLAHTDGTGAQRVLSEEDRKWLMEAIQSQSGDVVKRMKEITLVMQIPDQVLEAQGITPQDIEDLLNELQEYVESIDMANDLHSIGGLVPLLNYLKNAHANVRAKAADVVTTIVQNNPKSQQLVMEAKSLEQLITNFTSDPDENVRTMALGAISSLIRNSEHGMTTFRLANGYAALRDALCSENLKLQRKALSLISYILHENKSDCTTVAELGFLPVILRLALSEDGGVREAALQIILEFARCKPGETTDFGSSIKENEKLKQLLKDRAKDISKMSPEDIGAANEEIQLVDSLWKACYGVPSPLAGKGLLVIPGEDAPPPDVASKHFEPPFRAWAANRELDESSGSEKEKKPLLL